MVLRIAAVILTHNEEQNIKYCLESIYNWIDEIFIVDSFSTDNTVKIAKNYTDNIFYHEFKNYASQFNWAIANLPIHSQWIFRLDADEYVETELKRELESKLPLLSTSISGIYIKRKIFFLNAWIKHGGMYPLYHLRIWRKGMGFCEEKWMDEHIKVIDGKVIRFENAICDKNRKCLHFWIEKHNKYAIREAIDVLNIKYKFTGGDVLKPKVTGSQEVRKRYLKENLYLRMPMFIRAFFYFFYRYFFRLGFLDGKQGLVFHFLQGCAYRFLVDSKIFEIMANARLNKKTIAETIKALYDIDIP
jgi:glycosyltransferase involved in cell wall biosynthesis